MTLLLKWTASVITVLVFVDVTNCDRYEHLKSAMRGQFDEERWPAELQVTIYKLKKDPAKHVAAIGKEITCNESYYNIYYLLLTIPEHFSCSGKIVSLYKDIENPYKDWETKMLLAAFNVTLNDNEMDVSWLLFLFVKWVHVHVSVNQSNKLLPTWQTAHYGMYKVLLCTMSENDCTMFNRNLLTHPTSRLQTFPEYLTDLIPSLTTRRVHPEPSVMVKQLLAKHWNELCHNSSLGCIQVEDGTSDAVKPLAEEHLTLNMLYLNDMFDKTSEATALLTEFGVYEDGIRLVDDLKTKITEIKSGRTSFGQYVLSLVDFHGHVMRALTTIMLRIYYSFLEKFKNEKPCLKKKTWKLFFETYKEWCDFLHLPKSNPLYAQPSGDDNTSIHESQRRIIETLTVLGRESNDSLNVNYTAQSMERIRFNENNIKASAKQHNIKVSSNLTILGVYTISWPIMCAQVIIGIIKKIFPHIHYKAIQSLVKLRTSENFNRFSKYEQQYKPNMFSRKDETQSILVCDT
ncbi:uncharacterized protein LOC126843111 [Adelges cooleyi]|uniref:uncharacterized protein LOC126843111 n=1 Tax=Adelges cooleyi TaxID=133065 RepID=UPI0021802192|nr:uncharacterized protein LOC126843111 [Adelges cooleyi]